MSVVQKSVDSVDASNVLKKLDEPQVTVLTISKSTGRFDRIKLARFISLLLHPFVVAPLALVLVLYLDSGDFRSALGWAGLCAAFVIGPALIYLHRKLKQQDFSDADVSIREQRHGFYLFGGGCMLICFAVLFWLEAPQLLIASFTAALVTIMAFAIITRLWTKVSIHTGIMAGVTAMVAFYAIPLALLLGIGTLFVAWSRLVLQRHTLRQVVLGGVVGIASICLVFIPIVSL